MRGKRSSPSVNPTVVGNLLQHNWNDSSFNHRVDVYVLKLESGKYYVGTTTNWEPEHFAGNSSTWTKLYRPLELLEVQKNVDQLFEDWKVKDCMKQFGMNKAGRFPKRLFTEGTLHRQPVMLYMRKF